MSLSQSQVSHEKAEKGYKFERIVVVGVSLGGLKALQTLLGGLPADFPLPVVIVQHRAEESDDNLNLMSLLLQNNSGLPVREPEDKEAILPGWAYLAPAGYHMLVEEDEEDEEESNAFALSTEAPVCYARPSIDALFESAATAYRAKVIGVVLTGASEDGACGAAEIKRRGGLVVVQKPETAESPVMPQAAMAATKVDQILPLSEIASFLVKLCDDITKWR